VVVKGERDHCRTAEYTIRIIEKFIHGTTSDDETTAVSSREQCPESPSSGTEKHRQDQGDIVSLKCLHRPWFCPNGTGIDTNYLTKSKYIMGIFYSNSLQ
jgi:hypothetical protein